MGRTGPAAYHRDWCDESSRSLNARERPRRARWARRASLLLRGRRGGGGSCGIRALRCEWRKTAAPPMITTIPTGMSTQTQGAVGEDEPKGEPSAEGLNSEDILCVRSWVWELFCGYVVVTKQGFED